MPRKLITPYDMTDHAAVQRHTEQRARQNAWAQHLAHGDWHLFMTLTFDAEVVDVIRSVREFEHRYVTRLQQRSQGRIVYAGVIASNTEYGRVHIHCVVRFAGKVLKVAECQAAWAAGHSKMSRYDATQQGTHYIAKHITRPHAELLLQTQPYLTLR